MYTSYTSIPVSIYGKKYQSLYFQVHMSTFAHQKSSSLKKNFLTCVLDTFLVLNVFLDLQESFKDDHDFKAAQEHTNGTGP